MVDPQARASSDHQTRLLKTSEISRSGPIKMYTEFHFSPILALLKKDGQKQLTGIIIFCPRAKIRLTSFQIAVRAFSGAVT